MLCKQSGFNKSTPKGWWECVVEDLWSSVLWWDYLLLCYGHFGNILHWEFSMHCLWVPLSFLYFYLLKFYPHKNVSRIWMFCFVLLILKKLWNAFSSFLDYCTVWFICLTRGKGIWPDWPKLSKISTPSVWILALLNWYINYLRLNFKVI